jgi:hypothetical protein
MLELLVFLFFAIVVVFIGLMLLGGIVEIITDYPMVAIAIGIVSVYFYWWI